MVYSGEDIFYREQNHQASMNLIVDGSQTWQDQYNVGSVVFANLPTR